MSYKQYRGLRGHSSFSAEGAVFNDRRVNDKRLQKAIQYLKTDGRGDAINLYSSRVRAIDKHMLRKFPAQGKLFDSRLYRHLRSLVREAQNDVQATHKEEQSSWDRDSNSVVEALYRGVDNVTDFDASSVDDYAEPLPSLDRGEQISTTVNRSSAPRPILKIGRMSQSSKITKKKNEQVHFAKSPGTSEDNDVREKRFLYGGPNNGPERWFKDSPAFLPIGETPYIEKCESMKISHHLTKSAREITDGVGLSDFERVSIYDSGSRYKLPAETFSHWLYDEDRHAKMQKIYDSIVGSFNIGGPLVLDDDREYTPRITLPIFGKIEESVRVANERANEERMRDEEEHIRRKEERMHKEKEHTKKVTRSQPVWSQPLPQTSLKKFDSKREATVQGAKVAITVPKTNSDNSATQSAPVKLSKLSAPTTQLTPRSLPVKSLVRVPAEPIKQKRGRPAKKLQDPSYRPPRRVSDDSDLRIKPDNSKLEAENNDVNYAGPAKRKKGYPTKKPHDPIYHPPRRPNLDAESPTTPDKSTLEAEINELSYAEPARRRRSRFHKASADPNYRPEQSPVTPTKRKWDEYLNYSEPTKKPKKPKASRKKSPSIPSHAGFVGQVPTPTTKTTTSKKATPNKRVIKKPKRISAEDRELANNPVLEGRGKTRSNKDFKPERLRSGDYTNM